MSNKALHKRLQPEINELKDQLIFQHSDIQDSLRFMLIKENHGVYVTVHSEEPFKLEMHRPCCKGEHPLIHGKNLHELLTKFRLLNP